MTISLNESCPWKLKITFTKKKKLLSTFQPETVAMLLHTDMYAKIKLSITYFVALVTQICKELGLLKLLNQWDDTVRDTMKNENENKTMVVLRRLLKQIAFSILIDDE